MRITIATSEANLEDTRHLAVALGWVNGYVPSEWEQSFHATYQDNQGNLFRVSSFEASPEWIQSVVAMGPIERPVDDVADENGNYVVDLDAAHRAQNRLVLWQNSDLEENPIPQVDQNNLVAIAGISGLEALSAIGLYRIPSDSGI